MERCPYILSDRFSNQHFLKVNQANNMKNNILGIIHLTVFSKLGPFNVSLYLVFLFLAGVSVCQGEHENHCKELTDYGDLYYSKVKINVCNTRVERKCHTEPVTMCMEVPEIACQVGFFKPSPPTFTLHTRWSSSPTASQWERWSTQ